MNFITQYFDKVLVPEWRRAWQMACVLWNTLCAAVAPAWLILSDDQKASVLSAIGVKPAWLVAGAFVVSIALRLKAQGITAENREGA
ncbi:MAG: hypothetical protein J7605_02465 [Variovorax sp.]|nr:hypothetical protein [Variovorax sp.]